MESQEKEKTIKTWWAPVWKGLVFDEKGKHCRRMKNAVWLFLYFLLSADRRTGVLKRKIKTIGSDMGVSRTTICRWLDILRRTGYVVTRNSGHCLSVQIERWKPLSGIPNLQHQMFHSCDTRYPKLGTPEKAVNFRIPDYFWPKTAISGGANKSRLNKILRNERKREVGHLNFERTSPVKGFTSIGVYAQRARLAWDISKILDDTANIRLYRSYVQKYPEWLLKKVLAEVLKAPPRQISYQKGRSALFNSLLQLHVSRTIENSRH